MCLGDAGPGLSRFIRKLPRHYSSGSRGGGRNLLIVTTVYCRGTAQVRSERWLVRSSEAPALRAAGLGYMRVGKTTAVSAPRSGKWAAGSYGFVVLSSKVDHEDLVRRLGCPDFPRYRCGSRRRSTTRRLRWGTTVGATDEGRAGVAPQARLLRLVKDCPVISDGPDIVGVRTPNATQAVWGAAGLGSPGCPVPLQERRCATASTVASARHTCVARRVFRRADGGRAAGDPRAR